MNKTQIKLIAQTIKVVMMLSFSMIVLGLLLFFILLPNDIGFWLFVSGVILFLSGFYATIIGLRRRIFPLTNEAKDGATK